MQRQQRVHRLLIRCRGERARKQRHQLLGLGSFLAQIFLRHPLIRAATQEFHVDGTWTDPRVTRVARSSAPPETTGAAGAAAEPATR